MNSEKTLADLIAREVSLLSRIKYTVLLIAGGGMAALVGALWATEPELPLRTHLSFAAIVLVGLGWAGLAGWVLSKRRPLFALDRVIAASIALAASLIFTLGSVWIAQARAAQTALVAVMAIGATTVAASARLLWSAVSRRSQLKQRLDELEDR
jgi:hypothetical protein